MKQRLLAILAAVVLVAAGVVVRQRLAGDGGSGGGGSTGGGTPVVACTEDLQPVCDALVADGVIRAADPIDLAEAKDPATATKVDGWLTWDPAPGVANFLNDASGANPVWEPGTPVSSAPLGLARAKAAPVKPDCWTTWACLADQGAKQTLLLAVGEPTTARGLAFLYPLAVPLVGDQGYDQFQPSSLKALLNAPSVGQTDASLDKMLTATGAFDAAVAPAGVVDAALRTPRGTSYVKASPTPGATVTVVLAPPVDGRRSLDRVRKALAGGAPKAALAELGLGAPGELAPTERAGQLYQVYKKVGT